LPERHDRSGLSLASALRHSTGFARNCRCAADAGGTRLYYKSYGDNRSSNRSKDDEPFSTVAFSGLTREGDRLWAVGIDGIYAIGPGGTALIPLPHFKDTGGMAVSFDLPHFVLVLTNVNQRRSISEAVPLLVPR
jgi:hypothetical protein